MEGQFDAYCIV